MIITEQYVPAIYIHPCLKDEGVFSLHVLKIKKP